MSDVDFSLSMVKRTINEITCGKLGFKKAK